MGRAPTLAALGLLAWLSVAAAWGEDPLYAWIGSPERHFGVLTWALCFLAFVAAQSVCATKGLHAHEPVLAGLVVAGLGLGVLATRRTGGPWTRHPPRRSPATSGPRA